MGDKNFNAHFMNYSFHISENETEKNIFFKVLYSTENKKKSKLFKTPIKINKEDWDSEKERPKNIYLKSHKKIYNCINEVRISTAKYMEEAVGNNQQSFRKAILEIIQNACSDEGHPESFPENSLLQHMLNYIETRREMISKSTYMRYRVFFELIKKYEGVACKRFQLFEIDANFINHFVAYCKNEDYSENTIYRSIHFIKTILNFAEKKGIKTAVRELEIRREKRNTELITLSEAELLQLHKKKVPNNLKPAKDWLIISCYTGQRISDFMNFTVHKLRNIQGKTCIEFQQQKTGKKVLLPLHPIVLEILKDYSGCFPPKISFAKYNEQIKEVAKLAGISEIVDSKKRIDHRVKKVSVEKHEVITSHIGRRSFATNFYGKIPTPLLMEATGHSTEQMFLKYIGSNNFHNTMILGNFFEKSYNSKNHMAEVF